MKYYLLNRFTHFYELILEFYYITHPIIQIITKPHLLSVITFIYFYVI